MPKIYMRGTCVDEVLPGAERYNILDNNGTLINGNVQISLAVTPVIPGTPITAAYMNNIEAGLDGIDNKVAAMEVHPTVSKSTPVDADELGLWDSAASYGLKKFTWANLKATLLTYFSTLFASLTQPIKETGAGTLLTTGAIADGQFLQRSGNTLIGALPIAGKVVNVLAGTVLYTPTVGVRALYVEAVGGGGAGGGAATSSSTLSLGGGGGGGSYSAAYLTGAAIKASYTVVVGAGGTPGAAGVAGGAGADTTFDSPSVVTAKGGAGGAVLPAGSTLITQAGALGGASASGVGDIKAGGANGGWGVRLSITAGHAGDGGDGPVGGGTAQGANVTLTPGSVGANYGGGGSGAMTITTAQAGGAGAPGLLRITEIF